MILVVNANSSACRFYHYNKHRSELTLLKEIQHPENKLKNSELTSDKISHYQANHSGQNAYSPHMDARETKINHFTREIAQVLDHERKQHTFKKLILIAPPHLHGLLFQHLNKHVIELITNNIQKDLYHFTDHELINYLGDHAQFPDPS